MSRRIAAAKVSRRPIGRGVGWSIVAAAATAGCHAPMSIFRTGAVESKILAGLTWFLIILSAIIYAIVIGILVAALRRRRHATTDVDLTPRNWRFPIIGGAIVPGIVLLVLFVASVRAERAFPDAAAAPVRFAVIGHQWWWEVRYQSGPGKPIAMADEIHVPIGRPVEIALSSVDVIHSFWIPGMHGKIDLIPGDTNAIRFTATRAGVYRGQCAEYCGLQHAHMAFTVVADPPAAFAAWAARERDSAAVPADSERASGEALITHGPCALCHTIRGTSARGTAGPDLTHVGSRHTLAGGGLPNNLATMTAWITNAQSLKPGSAMPSLPQFTGVQLRAMARYLESLQ